MYSLLTFIILIILLLWLIRIYNRFITLINQVDAAWSDISVQLKRRHDLIPKLVELVQQYARYEQSVLSRVTELRNEGKKIEHLDNIDPEKTGFLEQTLSKHLHKMIILAEDYPDLKASQHFIELQQELSAIEDVLQHARRFYNGAVRLLNTRIDSFPDLAVARLFNYQYRHYFQMDSN